MDHQIIWKQILGDLMLCFCETCDIKWSFTILFDLENPLKNQIEKSHPEKEKEIKVIL